MPIADLPYRIERLAAEGQYAYLARPAIRAKVQAPEEELKKPRVKTQAATRLRVLRNVNLCDGPSLWDSLRVKREAAGATEETSDEYNYAFYVTLRLFATRSMVEDYLTGPEVASYCLATNTPLPTLGVEDRVITEESYLNEASAALTTSEYTAMLQSRDTHLSIESLEELVCQIQGIDSIETLSAPKRGRKKKIVVVTAPVVTPPLPTAPVVEEPDSSDEEAAAVPTTPSDRPSTEVSKATLPKKRKPRATLRDQFVLVQNTPSRLIDVSGYGDTMQHQRGRVLDRVRHGERLAKCTALPDLFPIVSDNIPAFERAMAALGPRYSHRIQQFKTAHGLRLKEKQVAA